MATVYAKESLRPDLVELVSRNLAPRGIAVERVPVLPADLGYSTGKYALQRPIPHAQAMAYVRAGVPDQRIIPTTRLADADLTGEAPFVLKRPDFDSHGVNKFLVSTALQRQRLEHFREERPQRVGQWAVQPYIEGPMRRVRSAFRMVATASGLVVASSLLYRVTSPDEVLQVPFELATPDHPSPQGRRYSNAEGWVPYFAHPRSSYYLGSAVIASNAAPGSRVIPLKINGELDADTSRLTRLDHQVAEAHGVGDLETPPGLLAAARVGGRVLGPHVDLIMGGDFIPDKRVNNYLSEFNASPAQDTTRAWYGFPPTMSVHEVYAFELNMFANGLRAPG